MYIHKTKALINLRQSRRRAKPSENNQKANQGFLSIYNANMSGRSNIFKLRCSSGLLVRCGISSGFLFLGIMLLLSSCTGSAQTADSLTQETVAEAPYFLEYHSFEKMEFVQPGKVQGYLMRLHDDGQARLYLLEHKHTVAEGSKPYNEILYTSLRISEMRYRATMRYLEQAHLLQLPEVLPSDPRQAMYCANGVENPGIAMAGRADRSQDDSPERGGLTRRLSMNTTRASSLADVSKSIRITYHDEDGNPLASVSATPGCSLELYPQGFLPLYTHLETLLRDLRDRRNTGILQQQNEDEPEVLPDTIEIAPLKIGSEAEEEQPAETTAEEEPESAEEQEEVPEEESGDPR